MKFKPSRFVYDYIINRKTMAIVPVLTVDNRILSGILEEEDTFIALPRPYEVVDQSCRFHGSSFEGRKEGTRELIGITHKAPIAISSTESLYFLSTLSYTRRECSWISHFHVTNTKATPHNNVLITFMNGQSFEVGISKTSFDTLLYRTAHLRSESEDRQKRKLLQVSRTVNKQDLPQLASEPMYPYKAKWET